MLLLGASANFIINALSTIFISLLDWVAYGLVSISYTIFLAISNLNIFGTNGIGEQLFKDISSSLYTLMSVIVVFIFAYYLLMNIIDPDKSDGTKKSSTFVKDTAISIGAIILMPLIFDYMFIFQTHVLVDQTIPAIILGTNPAINQEAEGDSIALLAYSSMYHPADMVYSDFVDENGKVKEANVVCSNKNGDAKETCELYAKALKDWEGGRYANKIGYITSNYDLRKKIGVEGGMEYMWILSTICGVVVAWFFFSYAIDLGTRAVKLGCLQLIAPIPVILRVFPKERKSFDTWFSEIKKSYLEIFARVAVIFFVVKLITMVPSLLDMILASDDNIPLVIRPLATIVLIFGLLKFAKEAPELFKNLFAGDLFKGINFKPGALKRIQDNDLAMRGMAGLSGMALGGVSAGIRRGIGAFKANQVGDGKSVGFGKSLRTGIGSTIRGGIAGAKYGIKSNPKDFGDLKKSIVGGIDTAHATADSPAWRRLHDAKEAANSGGSFVKEFMRPTRESLQDAWNVLSGSNMNSSKTAETAQAASSALGQVTSRYDSSVEAIKNAEKDAINDLINKGVGEFFGQTYDAKAAYVPIVGETGIIFNPITKQNEQIKTYSVTDSKGNSYTVDGDGLRLFKDANGYHYQDALGQIVQSKDKAQDIKSAIVSAREKELESRIKSVSNNLKYETFQGKWNEDSVRDSIKAQISNVNTYLSKHLSELGEKNVKNLNNTVAKNYGDPNMTLDKFLKEASTTSSFSVEQVKTLVSLKSAFGDIEKNARIAEAMAKKEKEDKKS